ncbi:MAG: response regulator [Candidatus Eremiobacteraeota bacterium]|nr:response regulator [Candidatus Eremiobacteraeota bacterium]
MNEKQRVFLVDDDPSVRRAVDRLLRSEGYVAEVFSSAGEFLEKGTWSGPACLVLDVNMPDLSGLDLQHEMNEKGMALPIIFITGFGDIPMTVKAMKGGAADFLTKPFNDEELLEAVRDALEKQNGEHQEQRALKESRLLVQSLTTRQEQVFRRIIGGMLNKQIAFELGISEKTVKFHRGELMKKLGATSVAGLVRLAEQAGIKPLPGS